ncbi:MAG: hypothetical protein E7496_04265 [Ruminococcus sp.]|nr:hypothetical protein [Ruminococcus sp.]
MKMNRIAAGVLAFTMVFAGSVPALENTGIIKPLTAQAMSSAVPSNWNSGKYYEVGDYTIQYVQLGYVQIIKCNNTTAEEITIPATMNDGDTDFPVQVLYPESFQECQMKKVTIPDTVNKIGAYAFCNCTNLEEVSGMENVENIAEGAFESCTALKSINLPDTLTNIGKEAFAFCTALTEVTVPGNVNAFGGYIFTTCTSLQTLSFAEGITTIPDKIAYQCSALKKVNIPASVTRIRDHAFELSALEEIVIPDTVQNIGEGAFNNCLYLRDVTLSSGMENIEVELFKDCHALENVVIPDSITRIRRNAFNGCNALKTVNLPESITRIEGYAFYNCEALESINLPSKITSIDEYTFCKCRSLPSIDIPKNVEKIGVYAFYDCESLENIIIPASVQSIGSYAFYNCTALTSAIFEGSMSELGIWSFAGCTALTQITLPEGLEKLSNHVLYRCESLETLDIPETVTKIDGYALAGCSSLTEVEIPASVEKVGEYAVGYGEGVIPEVDENINIVSESPAVQEFCKENTVRINGEGGIVKPEAVDLDTLGNYLHGRKTITEAQFKGADVNGDGVVNIFDWIQLRKTTYVEHEDQQPIHDEQDTTEETPETSEEETQETSEEAPLEELYASWEIGSVSAVAGQSGVKLPISVSADDEKGSAYSAFNFEVSIPREPSLTNIEVGTEYNTMTFDVANSSGTIKVSATSPEGQTAGANGGAVLYLIFDIPANIEPGEYAVTFNGDVTAVGADNTEVNVNEINGYITILPDGTTE